MSILICGEALIDVFASSSVQVDSGIELNGKIGGSACNVAMGVARLGQKVALFTGISNDSLGCAIKSFIEAQNISSWAIVQKSEKTPLVLASIDKQGVPSYQFYAENTAEQQLEYQDFSNSELTKQDVVALQFGCYSLLKGKTSQTYYQIAKEHHKDLFISLDPNIRLTIEPDIKVWKSVIEKYIPFLDLIKVSEEDLEYLFDKEDERSVVDAWLGDGVTCVIITRGSKGVSAYTKEMEIFLPSMNIDVVDTVGAGDSFLAGVLVKLSEGSWLSKDKFKTIDEMSLSKVVSFGITASALTCTKQGPDLPYKVDLKKFMCEDEA